MTQKALFQEQYLTEVLAIGLPKEFKSMDMKSMKEEIISTKRRRSSGGELTINQFNTHLEVVMLCNLKNFYSSRKIDVDLIVDSLKQEIRMLRRDTGNNEATNSAYWELVKLIFTAFYLDHSQNAFLNKYFTVSL